MDKGIRPYARTLFVEMSPTRVSTREGNTAFRKNIIAKLMEEFDVTLASGATHYNEAFKYVKETQPELVVGLGRPEDKKGGRKPKVKTEAVVAPVETPAETPAAAPVLDESVLPAPAPAVVWPFAEGYVAPQAAPEVTQKFVVRRKKDQVVVAEFESAELAQAAIDKAKQAKKAALELVA